MPLHPGSGLGLAPPPPLRKGSSWWLGAKPRDEDAPRGAAGSHPPEGSTSAGVSPPRLPSPRPPIYRPLSHRDRTCCPLIYRPLSPRHLTCCPLIYRPLSPRDRTCCPPSYRPTSCLPSPPIHRALRSHPRRLLSRGWTRPASASWAVWLWLAPCSIFSSKLGKTTRPRIRPG